MVGLIWSLNERGACSDGLAIRDSPWPGESEEEEVKASVPVICTAVTIRSCGVAPADGRGKGQAAEMAKGSFAPGAEIVGRGTKITAREAGSGDREAGTGDQGAEIGNQGAGSGDRGAEIGDRGAESGDRGAEIGG